MAVVLVFYDVDGAFAANVTFVVLVVDCCTPDAVTSWKRQYNPRLVGYILLRWHKEYGVRNVRYDNKSEIVIYCNGNYECECVSV